MFVDSLNLTTTRSTHRALSPGFVGRCPGSDSVPGRGDEPLPAEVGFPRTRRGRRSSPRHTACIFEWRRAGVRSRPGSPSLLPAGLAFPVPSPVAMGPTSQEVRNTLM